MVIIDVDEDSYNFIINVDAGEIPINNASIEMSSSDDEITFSAIEGLGDGKYKVTANILNQPSNMYVSSITARASKYGFEDQGFMPWLFYFSFYKELEYRSISRITNISVSMGFLYHVGNPAASLVFILNLIVICKRWVEYFDLSSNVQMVG